MFKISNCLLEKIQAKIDNSLLNFEPETAAYSCQSNCHGNCDNVELKKKPH